MKALGLIAGAGDLPLVFARGAAKAGRPVYALGFKGITRPTLESKVEKMAWLGLGNLGGLLRTLKDWGIRELVMEGQVKLKSVFSVRPDLLGLRVLAGLKEKSGEAILRALAVILAKNGVRLLDCRTHMEAILAPRGPGIPAGVATDLRLGLKAARALAKIEGGQTVVVKGGILVALEGLEGTDACLKRAAALAGKGCVAVKVASARGDYRFDVPTVGPRTLQVLRAGGYKALGVEAGKTFLIGGANLIQSARSQGIHILGL